MNKLIKKSIVALLSIAIVIAMMPAFVAESYADSQYKIHLTHVNITSEQLSGYYDDQNGMVDGETYDDDASVPYNYTLLNYYSDLIDEHPIEKVTINGTDFTIPPKSGDDISAAVDGVPEPLLLRSVGNSFIIMPQGKATKDVNITITFKKQETATYTPSISVASNETSMGTIATPGFVKNTDKGSQYKLTATPAAGYKLSYIEDASGNKISSSDGKTITWEVTSNAAYTAHFEKIKHITKVVGSNYGSYASGSLWVNCGASFYSVENTDKVQFFLTKTENGTIDTAIAKGAECTVADVKNTTDATVIRNAKLDTGFEVKNQAAGSYWIGCKVDTTGSDGTVYAYTPFTIYPTAKAYATAGLNKVIKTYQTNWYANNGKYTGLGVNTDAYGNDWEAWIFTALGTGYDLDGTKTSFAVDSDFLKSSTGKTYFDNLKATLDYLKANNDLDTAGSKTIFKMIAAVAACGKDPRDFEGYNLVKMLIKCAYNSDGTPAIDSNGCLKVPDIYGTDDALFLSYELLGLEIAGATPEEGYTTQIREAGIKKLLSIYGADKISTTTKLALDYYTMAMLPMQFLRSDDKYKAQIDAAMDNMRNVITTSYISDNGAMTYVYSGSGSAGWNISNADTEAVAINSLVAAGLTAHDIGSGSYQKTYGSLLTSICGDIVDDGVVYGDLANRMATYQTLGALVDLYNGKSCFAIAHDKYKTNYPKYFADGYGKFSLDSVDQIDDQNYTGNAIEPKIKVYANIGGKKTLLTEGTDYKVTYSNNMKPGTATATIIGTGDFTGKKIVSFTISRVFTKTTIAISSVDTVPDQTYTGNAIEPKLRVYAAVAGKKTLLTEGTDYKVTYSNNTNEGVAKATITGIGSYAGTQTVTFNIKKQDAEISASIVSKTVFTGNPIKPSVTVLSGNTRLTENKDYTLQYYHNTSVGTASVVVTMTGNYSGTETLYFKIMPRRTNLAVKVGMHKVVLKWKRINEATGYCIYRKAGFNGKYKKIKTINKGNVVRYQNSKLRVNKKYFYKVRTFTTVGGHRIYGRFSNVKVVRTR